MRSTLSWSTATYNLSLVCSCGNFFDDGYAPSLLGAGMNSRSVGELWYFSRLGSCCIRLADSWQLVRSRHCRGSCHQHCSCQRRGHSVGHWYPWRVSRGSTWGWWSWCWCVSWKGGHRFNQLNFRACLATINQHRIKFHQKYLLIYDAAATTYHLCLELKDSWHFGHN